LHQDYANINFINGGTDAAGNLIPDHLGNTRTVITEEAQTDVYPTLTFEGASPTDVANQNAVWDNSGGNSINVISSRVTPLPTGFCFCN
jgi:hypothetical protein